MALGNGTELTWYGHATWLLVTPDGKRILIDPWKTGNPAWPAGLDDPGDIDALLITHAHSDHMADAVPMAAAGKPEGVVCMIEIGDYLEKKGVENIIGMNKGGSVDVAGCRVTMVPASHSSSFEDDDGYVYLGDPIGFVVRTGDLSLYISGDTCVFGDMALIARLYKPNVALLPIGGYFTMDPYEAAEAVRLLGVKKVVPSHYGTFPLIAGTPDQLRQEASDVTGLEVLDVQPGGTVT